MATTTASHFVNRQRLPSAQRQPLAAIAFGLIAAFAAIGVQSLRLALRGPSQGARANVAEPLVRVYSRPDIVDAKGRLLATDLMAHSLFADPTLVIDADEASEQISSILRDIDPADLRHQLADKNRRFVWIRRGLSPAIAQRIHDLGLPGIAFRNEPRRVYPQGRMAGHILGSVGIDNRGLAGIERHIDEMLGLETSYSAADTSRAPVALTLDIGAQHALEEELALALARYGATGAAGVILDPATGAVLAAASLPDADPARPGESLLADRIDRLSGAVYELGSIMKVFTVAMALDSGIATPSTILDVRVPVQAGGWTIRDMAPAGRPLSVREVLVQSSNVGSALLALQAGTERQRAFMVRAGLIEPMRMEAGPLGVPRIPERWRDAETATIAYGYGMALSPMQAAAGFAALVNGGLSVAPHVAASIPGVTRTAGDRRHVVSEATSAAMRDMLRRAVTQTGATGRRADVPGLEVGGKTGTAEMAVRGGYRAKSVVASFLGAFPMSAPRYVVLVTLVEPRPGLDGDSDRITAGVNAAPVAARIIARSAPALGVAPH